MTVVVNTRNEEEEKVLLAFLSSLQYDYESTYLDIELTMEQKDEILRREKSFAEGKTAARSWDEIKKDLDDVYR